MANVFDVAAYVLDKCKETYVDELEGYIRYAQAWNFIWTGKFLFQPSDANSLSVFLDGKKYLEAGFFSSVGHVENLTSQEKSDIDKVILFYRTYEDIKNSRIHTNLSSLESSRELVEQLNVDVEKILADNYKFLFTALNLLKLDDELKNNFNHTLLEAACFSDNMRAIESNFSAFAKLLEFCAKIFVEAHNPVIEEAISKLHDSLCCALNFALEDIVKKYKVVTKKFLDEGSVFLSQDCFTPACYNYFSR